MWKWIKDLDGEGHVYWKGFGPDGAHGTIWRSGGNSGEFVTEYPDHGHYETLIEAKAAVSKWWA